MFGRRFDGAKCRTQLTLTVGRVRLLRNKNEAKLKLARGEIAALLRAGKADTARIRVEGLLREEGILGVYDILELFCELLAQRWPMVERAKEPPPELREAIATIIFAAPRLAELAELSSAREQLLLKFGDKDGFATFASQEETARAAGANGQVWELLAVRVPSPDAKRARLADVAREHGVPFDEAAFTASILESPADLANSAAAPPHLVQQSPPPLPPPPPPPPQLLLQSVVAPVVHLAPMQPASAPAPGRAPHAHESDDLRDVAAAAHAAARAAEQAAAAAAAAAQLARAMGSPASPASEAAAAVSASHTPPPAAEATNAEPGAEARTAHPSAHSPAPPSSPPPAPPPTALPASEADDGFDELSRRFEALKRKA